MNSERYAIALKIADYEFDSEILRCTAAHLILAGGMWLPQLLASLTAGPTHPNHIPVTLTKPADFEVTYDRITCTVDDILFPEGVTLSQLGAAHSRKQPAGVPVQPPPDELWMLWMPVTDAMGTVIGYTAAEDR